jgi:hypothetical protein
MADVKVEIVNSVNDVNIKEEVVTIVLGTSGPQGIPGPQGPRGNAVLSGEGSPDISTGIVGDFYIDVLTNELYGPKTSSSWGTPVDLVTNEELGYIHDQDVASNEWTIVHGLGFVPNITVVDLNGTVIEGSYNYPNNDTIIANFTESISGRAYVS